MISRYQEMISRYPEISRITDIGKWFPDIRESGVGVELPHLAFTTDDDEAATVVPPRLKSLRPKSIRPKSIRPNAVHTLFLSDELINTCLDRVLASHPCTRVLHGQLN